MKRRAIAVVVLLLLATAAYAAWRLLGDEEPEGVLVASGTVEATDARLGFQVPGRLAEVAVREGDEVTAGTVLARLDSATAAARRDQAAAQVDAARAQLDDLLAGARTQEVAEARAAAAAARDRLADARRDVERTRFLHEGGATPREALDKAELAASQAESQLEQATERLSLVEAGPRPERVAAQRAGVAQAEAALSAAETALGDLELTAPFGGVVTVRHREPGEVVGAGQPVLTLLDLDDRWVRIYVPEDRIGAVSLGAPAAITIDTYPDRRFEGEVRFIASEAEFTPKTVQTPEERVRLVYAVEVRVTGDAEGVLKPGMPADVTLDLPEAR